MSTYLSRAQRLKQDGDPSPVLFYRPQDPFGIFSNFSPHRVTLNDPFTHERWEYETSEHAYQAWKAALQADHDLVTLADGPAEAKRVGRTIALRDGWGRGPDGVCYLVMQQIVLAKALQHEVMFDLLLQTGDHVIYEDSPLDDIWGWKYQRIRAEANYNGQNLLGLALMNARTIIRCIAG